MGYGYLSNVCLSLPTGWQVCVFSAPCFASLLHDNGCQDTFSNRLFLRRVRSFPACTALTAIERWVLTYSSAWMLTQPQEKLASPYLRFLSPSVRRPGFGRIDHRSWWDMDIWVTRVAPFEQDDRSAYSLRPALHQFCTTIGCHDTVIGSRTFSQTCPKLSSLHHCTRCYEER